MDFEFTERRPGGCLGRYVESVWHARGQIPYTREKIAPTGSTVAGIVLGLPIRQTPSGGPAFLASRSFLIGPHDRPLVNEPTGRTDCVGVVTTPIGCRAVFGVHPAPLRGQVVDLLHVWPAAAPLRDDLLRTEPGNAVLDRTEAVLAAGLDESDRALDRCADVVAALEATPARVVGMPPRALARVLRVRRLLEHIDVQDDVLWTRLAADLGWYDQSHLVRDVTRHTGVPPSAYVRAQRRFLPPEDQAPGFVPREVKSLQDDRMRRPHHEPPIGEEERWCRRSRWRGSWTARPVPSGKR